MVPVMQAAIVRAANTKWELTTVAIPKPGPNDVLVKVRASGLCYTDVHITQGFLPGPFPRVLGHEVTGDVVALGSSVTSRTIGDRVGVPWLQRSCGRCEWCLRNKPLFCPDRVGTGNNVWGGHAEYLVAAANAAVPLPNSLSYSEAAPFLCAGYTVWSGIKAACPRPGDRIAVLGIGGLGHLAIQFSKALGFETAAITRSPDKLPLAKAFGADHAFLRVDQLRELGGADVILATCNSFRLAAEALSALRPEGSLVLLGLSEEPFTIANSLLFARQRVIGTFPSSPEDLYEALTFAGLRKVAAKIERYPLGRIADAYDRVANGTVRFRAVITDCAT